MSPNWRPLPNSQTSPAPTSDWLDQASPEQRETIDSAHGLLKPLFCISPYLADLARKNVGFLARLIQSGPDDLMHEQLEWVVQVGSTELVEAEISKQLRLSKGKVALLAAVAETGGVWTTKRATKAMSDLADVSVHAALNHTIRVAADAGKLAVDLAQASANNCGLSILALGKHGGQELNYSSDIDIVAFFDRATPILNDPNDAAQFFARIVRKLAALMQERTAYGYVFRTDLRLRPDPGSTPVALSVNAALNYYESRGQNWERAAWIKARHCAGDQKVGERFLADIAPFVWRKHLDFAAISDIQAMKRQINIAQNVGGIRVQGHNVKLGQGGIREIEFFAQTQQLIAGGRDVKLRERPTVHALSSLAQSGWITEEASSELSDTYWFLRAVENRLQMIRDEQTHTLPEHTDQLEQLATLMGMGSRQELESKYRRALAIVTTNYTGLFEQEETLSAQSGSLVFTGTDDDPETLKTLTLMGFSDPSRASATIRKWHYGGYRATRAAASREHLTELVPLLLETIEGAGSADAALGRFDDFLSRLPSGVQLFALLRAHEKLRQLLVAFLASAPKMAEAVMRRVHVMDGLLDPARTGEVVDPELLADKVHAFLDQADGYEDLIDRARIIGQEQMFLISAGLISGTLSARRTGQQFTVLAETLLTRLLADVRQTFAARHGTIPGAKVALLAFGKLGSNEMTASSDLDIVLLYDVPQGASVSDGERQLETSQYFTRLTQRMIAALSAPTATGVLYEVDMRLRPSGNAGPVATSFAAFRSYQNEKAWTWEHLALTRARVICADDTFGDEIARFVGSIFRRERQAHAVAGDVKEMRTRLLKDRPAKNQFDLKLIDGGLMDLEFVAQSATLLHADQLEGAIGDTNATLIKLQDLGLLKNGNELARYHRTMATVLQVMSACLTEPLKLDAWTDAFKVLLARLNNQPDLNRLELELTEMHSIASAAHSEWLAQLASSPPD